MITARKITLASITKLTSGTSLGEGRGNLLIRFVGLGPAWDNVPKVILRSLLGTGVAKRVAQHDVYKFIDTNLRKQASVHAHGVLRTG